MAPRSPIRLAGMYGDPGEVRAVARQLRALAAEVGDSADRLVAGHDMEWRSTAASTFRAQLTECTGQVRGCIEELEEAARAVDRHADEVAERLAAIAAAEVWARQQIAGLREEAEGLVEGVVGGVRDLAGDAWNTMRNLPDQLPTPGSVDWLDISERIGRGGRR